MQAPTKKRTTSGVVELCFKVPESRADAVSRLVSTFLEQRRGQAPDEFVPWEEIYPAFGPPVALRGARAREGLTQVELSQRLGIPQRHISEMEHGKRSIGKEMAKRLAKALRVDYRVFL